LTSRGLKVNGNQTENDRYGQKISFLLFAKCLKMYSFFAFAFAFHENFKMVIKKGRILRWLHIR
jgi:hypothetical protein